MRSMRTQLRPRYCPIAIAAALALAGPAAHGQTSEAPKAAATPTAVTANQLERVEVTGRHYDNAVGSSDAASQGTIRAELLKSRPALRPGEVLEFVPGGDMLNLCMVWSTFYFPFIFSLLCF